MMRLFETLGRWLGRCVFVGLIVSVLLIAFGLSLLQWVWDHLIWPALPWLAVIMVCGLLTVWLSGRIRRAVRRRHMLETERQRLVETMTGVPHAVSTWTWRPRR